MSEVSTTCSYESDAEGIIIKEKRSVVGKAVQRFWSMFGMAEADAKEDFEEFDGTIQYSGSV